MAKHKVRRPENTAQAEHGRSGLGIDAKQIGVAVAGVLATELVNIAIQKLSHKALNKDVDDADQDSDQESVNPVQYVASQVGDQVDKIGTSAGDMAGAVRSSVSNLRVSLSDVVDVLRDAGQQLKDQSSKAINTSANDVVENVSNGTTAVLDRVVSDTKKKSKKGNKNKKGKKKKG